MNYIERATRKNELIGWLNLCSMRQSVAAFCKFIHHATGKLKRAVRRNLGSRCAANQCPGNQAQLVVAIDHTRLRGAWS